MKIFSRKFKYCFWVYILFDILVGYAGFIPLSQSMAAQQAVNTYVQSYGPVSALVACTAAAGVNTSAANTPCGGQGGMFQNSAVTVHALSWTSVATVSVCTIELEQSSTGVGGWTLLGTQQTCTASGTYTATLSAAYVRVNINSLTTTGVGSLQFNYLGQVANPLANVVSSAINCGTATACAPAFTPGTFRLVYGSCTAAAATTCTVTAIAPPFTGTTSYFCAVSDATGVTASTLRVSYASSSSFVITGTSSSDTFNWLCWGT